jgi:hypothetical protein
LELAYILQQQSLGRREYYTYLWNVDFSFLSR